MTAQTGHTNGVFPAVKKNGERYFRSSITYRRRHISLGSFATEELAGCAYLCARNCLDTSVALTDYPGDTPLSFEKWVVLVNFRDNGIYFSTPIYLRNKYFEYYLDRHTVLKFDMDDLFYFSSRKIMCRGNHLFVADYGMQTSVLSRYGIQSYAVPDKDYRFVNGDRYDFRRQNLLIQNIYHGVRTVQTKNGPRYKVRIHLHGYYQVGTYATLTEAAIAYNKAIDILKKNGVSKNFLPNDLTDLSPSTYADIYSGITVSEKIRAYRPS